MFKIRKNLISKLLMFTMCTTLVTPIVALLGGGTAIYASAATATDASYFNFDARTGTILHYNGNDPMVVIPSTINGVAVKRIGELAFLLKQNLMSITIPSSVTQIDNSAFGNCSSLKSITIPNSVISIGENVFSGCFSLQNIIIDNNYYTNVNGVLFNKSKTKLMEYPEGKVDKSYIIPNGVASIANGAFQDCNLTSITIPSSVISIGDSAFFYCRNLTSVNIPNSVTSIGANAFETCTSLISMTIPSSITSIGKYAFNDLNNNFIVYVDSEKVRQLLINSALPENKIRLRAVQVTSIKLDTINLQLSKRYSTMLTPTILPTNATNKAVTWSSSNNQVATVSSNGNITGVGVGIAIITCSAADGSGKSATCKVTVTK
ncbi:leucine-rich repeat protein [Clostridium sp.]|uniref:leucine-rich repeat protein n=1 Tax=Clostridium sp. TaxID=1506 RepID=UPI00284F897B|nr:leucine-rich repeat protein [Clostridium sp.]MDR3595419.1 leucine-rich repeat protein [Clostridium sp.]